MRDHHEERVSSNSQKKKRLETKSDDYVWLTQQSSRAKTSLNLGMTARVENENIMARALAVAIR